MAMSLTINGTVHAVDVDGDMPLLWVLRDLIGLTGTKFGCGAALSGACTVHIDGQAVRSCVVRIDSIGNGVVTTIPLMEQSNDPAESKMLWSLAATGNLCATSMFANLSSKDSWSSSCR
jgi:isoquinoline 1-oxidoreductase alpha subunit